MCVYLVVELVRFGSARLASWFFKAFQVEGGCFDINMRKGFGRGLRHFRCPWRKKAFSRRLSDQPEIGFVLGLAATLTLQRAE